MNTQLRKVGKALAALIGVATLGILGVAFAARRDNLRLDDFEYIGYYGGPIPAPWYLDSVPLVTDSEFDEGPTWTYMLLEPRIKRVEWWPWADKVTYKIVPGYWLTAQNGQYLRRAGYKTAMIDARGDTVYFEVKRLMRSHWDIAALLDTLPPDTVRLFLVPGRPEDGSLK